MISRGDFLNFVIEYHIKDIREKRGISIRQLARDAGISHSFLIYLERGEKQPSFYVMCCLSEALKVNMNDLYTLRYL